MTTAESVEHEVLFLVITLDEDGLCHLVEDGLQLLHLGVWCLGNLYHQVVVVFVLATQACSWSDHIQMMMLCYVGCCVVLVGHRVVRLGHLVQKINCVVSSRQRHPEKIAKYRWCRARKIDWNAKRKIVDKKEEFDRGYEGENFLSSGNFQSQHKMIKSGKWSLGEITFNRVISDRKLCKGNYSAFCVFVHRFLNEQDFPRKS